MEATMIWDWILIGLGAICLLVGFAGCILPILPGVPLAYAGLLLLHATDMVQLSWQTWAGWLVVTIVVQALDSVIPIWGTKKFGGTKKGMWGSTIGLLIGMFTGPWGIIIGPFVGAVLFECIGGAEMKQALRAGFGSFIGFLSGTVLKMVVCGWMIGIFIARIVEAY